MPMTRLAKLTLLDELEFIAFHKTKSHLRVEARKVSKFEVCPKCATPSSSAYDSRWVRLKDAPIRGKRVVLVVKKRRFQCKKCRKPFTEPISGVTKGHKATARYKKHVFWACEHFTDLKSVRKHVGGSYSSLYRIYYDELSRKAKERSYPWPRTLGIDEHKFKKCPKYGYPIYATNIVDHKNKKVFDLVEGRTTPELKNALKHIPGRQNVNIVSMDLSVTYRKFVHEFFPNAKIVADKFHVLRLLHPAINRNRINITGDKRKNPARKLLLKNGKDLDFWARSAIWKFLDRYPTLKEIYYFKEALHIFYRTKGYNRARKSLKKLLDKMGRSKVKEIISLRKTLMAWKEEILNYFITRHTNGRVEGFNRKAKLINRRGYGYRSFKNYRLRVLNACV